MFWEVLGGKHLKGKLREMAAMIVASVNEMMKYSQWLTAHCTSAPLYNASFTEEKRKAKAMTAKVTWP